MTIKQILEYFQTQPFRVRLYVLIRVFILDLNRTIGRFPPKASSIMELACGYGIASFMLAGKYKHIPINSYDIDQKRIDILNSINPFEHLNFHKQNILEIQKFDSGVIFMSDLLHHLTYEQQKALLKKIYDTAPHDSLLIIKDMDKGQRSFRQLCNYMIDFLHTKQRRFYYHTKDSFLDLFIACGFKVNYSGYINKWFIPLNHALFVLEKEKKSSAKVGE
ncbi:MAG: hypothetical protein JW847_00055 [Candidatus Omnitrophica bacterium]|nr:hypothetical protein [Candidatus Omnitrophota bacterium]